MKFLGTIIQGGSAFEVYGPDSVDPETAIFNEDNDSGDVIALHPSWRVIPLAQVPPDSASSVVMSKTCLYCGKRILGSTNYIHTSDNRLVAACRECSEAESKTPTEENP